LPVLYGLETRPFKLKDEHGLRVFENSLARKIFKPKEENVSRRKENCIIRSFVIRNPHLILLGDQIKEDEMGGVCGMYQGNKKRKQSFGGKHWTSFHKSCSSKRCGI
jgi:hypothetical protein